MANTLLEQSSLTADSEAHSKNSIIETKVAMSADQVVSAEALHELDGIHDGLEFPTEEERATLRRVADKVPWNAYRA